ncbi:MAG: hypothetical protein JJT82_10135 [Legionellaceae bacterium]|nr:hypothetical protein [Legionellaceae bacterium]
MSKWRKFHSAHSPVVDMDKPNTLESNLQLDWARELGQDKMTINGRTLRSYEQDYNAFQTTADVKRFFSDVILQDVDSTDKDKKAEMVEYLTTAFHQGGFMYPVTTAFSTSVQDYREEFGEKLPAITVRDRDAKVHLETTSTGFKIQEIVGIKELVATDGGSFVALANSETSAISPEKGKKYIVELEGSIDVNFSKDSSKPQITVESNHINYFHEGVRSKLDTRSLGQRIVEFFKDILGLSKVEDRSPEIKSNTDSDHTATNAIEKTSLESGQKTNPAHTTTEKNEPSTESKSPTSESEPEDTPSVKM